jgi:preprotein translocase subunit Sec63
MGWALFAVVAYRAATMEIIDQEVWNPWDILGVPMVFIFMRNFE